MRTNLFSIVLFRINFLVLVFFASMFSMKSNAQDSFNFSDSTFEVGQTLTIQSIYFNLLNQDLTVDDRSKVALDSLVTFVKEHEKIIFELGVHTGLRGNAEANMNSGEIHSNNLRSYLINAGVNERQLIAKSYGETDPINLSVEMNCFVESDKEKQAKLHSQNQRIVLKILLMH